MTTKKIFLLATVGIVVFSVYLFWPFLRFELLEDKIYYPSIQIIDGFDKDKQLAAYSKVSSQKHGGSVHVAFGVYDMNKQKWDMSNEVFSYTAASKVAIQKVTAQLVKVYYYSDYPELSEIESTDEINGVKFEYIYLNVDYNWLNKSDKEFVDSVFKHKL